MKRHKIESKGISIAELLADLRSGKLKPAQPPKSPWTREEIFRRWQDSEENGHLEIVCKCTTCGLEFVLLSLRSEIEAMEAYQPDSGEDGGYLMNVTCPECGDKGKAILLRMVRASGAIYLFADTRH